MSRSSRTVTIVNQKGLHARASAKFVTFVSRLPEGLSVEVEKDGQNVTGSSIMGLMMLGAAKGSEITIHVEGNEADMALEKLAGLVTDGFDPHVFDGIESGILDADDLSMIAEELGPAQVAVVVVYEDRVLADVAAAWETAGGRELWSGGVDVAGLDESLASAGEDEN